MVRFLFNKNSYRTWTVGADLKDNRGKTVRDLIKELHEADAQNPLLLELTSRCKWRWQLRGLRKAKELAFQNSPKQSLDALLVVLTLVMTVTMQIGVSPPGGFWQDDGKTKDGIHYSAGEPIIATTDPILYQLMSLLNALVFVTSLTLILRFTAYMPMKNFVRFVLYLFDFSYFFAIGVNTSSLAVYVGLGASLILTYIYYYFNPYEQDTSLHQVA